MRLGVSKISGVFGDGTWSYVHLFSDGEEKHEAKGELLVILSINGISGVSEVEIGREILTRINEIYYGGEENVIEALKKTLKLVGEEFGSSEDETGIKLEILLNAFVKVDGKMGCSIAGIGGGEVWMRKGGKVGKIYSGRIDKEDGEIKVLSGWIGSEDVFIGGTKNFFGLAEGRIKAAMMNKEYTEVAETLAPIVEGRQGAAGAVVSVVNTNKTEVGEEVE